jgi:hypothetical protein
VVLSINASRERTMLGRITFIAAIAAAGCASAQTTPEQARAHADQLIKQTDAGQWFVNVTDGDTPLVRHVPSGMICVFPGVDDRNVVRLYPTQPDGPKRGDDAGCSAWWDDTLISMIATRYPQQYAEEDLFASAAGDIARSWEDAQPLEGEYGIITLTGQSEPRVAVYSGSRDGRPATNALVVRNIGEWSFKARGTSFPGDDETVRLTSGVFALALPGGWEAFRSGAED